jgi:cell division septum initiation protein DivIVA
MKNSIAIAERLVRSQNENKRLVNALEEGKQELAAVQAELAGALATMHAASGPDAYVVDRLQTQEKRLAELKAHSDAVEDHLRRTQDELQRLVRENGELKDELKKVLHNRQQLDSIRSAIDLLRGQQGVASASKAARTRGSGGGGGAGSGGRSAGSGAVPAASAASASATATAAREPQPSPGAYRAAPSVARDASMFGIHIQGGNMVREVGDSTGRVGSARARFHSRASPK